MKKADFINLIEDALVEDHGTFDGSESLEDAGWDSMAFMSFVSTVDSKLGITLAPDAISECETIGDLVKLAGDKITD